MHELIEKWRAEAAEEREAGERYNGDLGLAHAVQANVLEALADELEQALLRNRAEIIAITDSRANAWTRQEDGTWKAILAQPLVAGDTITIIPK